MKRKTVRAGGGKKPHFHIELAPVNLIDLVLVLLIFFITTTTFLKLKTIDLDLPVSATALDKDQKENAVISVGKDGKLYLDTVAHPFSSLVERLKEIKNHSPRTLFHLAADNETLHRDFIRAMDALNEAHIEKVAIVTREK